MNKHALSIIVPTYNEEQNIGMLVEQIDLWMNEHGITYEIIVIDDNSTDDTQRVVTKLATRFPVHLYVKKGEKGKAQSLLEGFEMAQHNVYAMIDADMQYPPLALPEMFKKIVEGKDIVVANRVEQDTPIIRKLATQVFRKVFGSLLHKLDYDVQSGMKMFKAKPYADVKAELHPSPWTFDMEFLLRARKKGYAIETVDIKFGKRLHGKSTINIPLATYEIAKSAIILKFKV